MPEFLPCFILLLIASPLILAIVALTKVASLRKDLERLRSELATLTYSQEATRQPPVRACDVTDRPHTSDTPTSATPSEVTSPALGPLSPGWADEALNSAAEFAQAEHESAAPTDQTDAADAPEFIPSTWSLDSPLEATPTSESSDDEPQPWSPPYTALPQPVPSSPPVPLEQRIIRFAVGVGGLALALAGIFLVKVAFEHNYLNPIVRILIGTLFGAALLAVGLARRDKEPGVAQALSAAGVADLFACFLAATNLYHIIPPFLGFILLAATTAIAVILSLRQGPFVALLGLVGGFLTPALINTGHPSALSLFGYLFILHVGLICVTRARQWAWLAALTVFASLAWVGLWLITQPWDSADGPILGSFLLFSTAAVALSTAFNETAWHSNPLLARLLTYFSLFLGCALSACLLARSHFSTTEWLFLGLLSAGCFTLGRLRTIYEPFAWFASAFVLVLLAAWGFTSPPDLPLFQMILSTFGVLFSLGSYGCLWGSRAPKRWAALSTVSALSYTLVAYFSIGHPPRPDTWAFLPLTVAGIYALLAIPVLRQREKLPTGVLSALVIAFLVALAFAPPMCLTTAQLTAAWSLLIPLAALLATRLRLNDLFSLLIIFPAFITLRLLNPELLTYPTGPTLFWNPLLWAYLPSIASMVAAIFIFERSPGALTATRELCNFLQVAASLLTLVFLALFVHRIFHPDTLSDLSARLSERATYPNVGLAAAFIFLYVGHHLKRPILTHFGYGAMTLAVFFVIAVQVLLFNPLWTPDDLGNTIIFNLLLYTYGLPALLATVLILWLRRRGNPADITFSQFAGIASIFLLFVLTSLEIRHAFHGPTLAVADPAQFSSSLIERSTYSAIWLFIAFPLLFVGRRQRANILTTAGFCFAVAGLAFTFFIEVLAQNPLWTYDDVGSVVIFNRLLYAYGLPAFIAAVLARWFFNAQDTAPAHRTFARFSVLISIVLVLVLITLEVRQSFQGNFLHASTPPDSAEMYAYSLAWGLFGTTLLIAGILTRGPILRWASLAVMLITIIKVFLFDTANLSDIFRVLSFAGLGLSLILLGFLYHHFVFRRPNPT